MPNLSLTACMILCREPDTVPWSPQSDAPAGTGSAQAHHHLSVEGMLNRTLVCSRCERRIFEVVYSTKGNKGNGFGLWIAKDIVEKHHARLQVKSSNHAPRTGSVFSLLLPCDFHRLRSSSSRFEGRRPRAMSLLSTCSKNGSHVRGMAQYDSLSAPTTQHPSYGTRHAMSRTTATGAALRGGPSALGAGLYANPVGRRTSLPG